MSTRAQNFGIPEDLENRSGDDLEWKPIKGGKTLPAARGRFDVEIVSVYYTFERDSDFAAVLVKTSFKLPRDRLKYAKCPLTIYDVAEDTNQQRLAITHYYPEKHEVVQLSFHADQGEWYFDPSIETVEVGPQSEGKKKSPSGEKQSVISLQAKPDPKITQGISWHYEDQDKSRYPDEINVLILVEKPAARDQHLWFEFKLQLTQDLKVDVHGLDMEGRFTDLSDWLAGIPEKGQKGWNFIIRGKYKPEMAREALDRLTSKKPTSHADGDPVLGLKAASLSKLALTPSPALAPKLFVPSMNSITSLASKSSLVSKLSFASTSSDSGTTISSGFI